MNGVYQFPRNIAVPFIPYKTVNIRGDYPNYSDLVTEAANQAKHNGAYAYQLSNIEDLSNDDGIVDATVSLFAPNAPVKHMGAVYHNVKGVTLKELSANQAAQMKEIDKISFSGSYSNEYEISSEAAKNVLAKDKNAKAFFINNVKENTKGTDQTVSVSYYQ